MWVQGGGCVWCVCGVWGVVWCCAWGVWVGGKEEGKRSEGGGVEWIA